LIYLNRLSSLFFAMELDLIQRETSHKPTMARESST
jgi:cob(I)alamin adenosyltransferase